MSKLMFNMSNFCQAFVKCFSGVLWTYLVYCDALIISSYGDELARLSGLARLGEMIFIPRSYEMFFLSSIKKFGMSMEKDYLIKYFLQ